MAVVVVVWMIMERGRSRSIGDDGASVVSNFGDRGGVGGSMRRGLTVDAMSAEFDMRGVQRGMSLISCDD